MANPNDLVSVAHIHVASSEQVPKEKKRQKFRKPPQSQF